MNLETAYANVGTMDKAIRSSSVPDQNNEEFVEYGLIPEGAIAGASAIFGTMKEALKSAYASYQQNKKSVETGLLAGGASNATSENL